MEHLSGLSASLNGPFTIPVHALPVVILKGVELHGTAQSLGTGEISSNVTGVQQAAGDTGAAAHQVLQASGELSRQSETMRGQVEAFLSNIKAA